MKFSRRSFIAASAASLAPRHASAAKELIKIRQGTERGSFHTVEAVASAQPQVALTFDDGPHQTNTPRLLDILREYQVRATFFVVGRRAATWPDVLRRIVEEGHEIGNHSWSHPHLDRYSKAGWLNEIDKTSNAVFDATGKAPLTFRPPYGSFTDIQSAALLAERDLTTIRWSVDPLDWRRPGPSVVANRVVDRATTGSIILVHDIHRPTVNSVPMMIEGLRNKGLQPVTTSLLLGWDDWSELSFRRRDKAVTVDR